jgi:hypothetical protein
MIYKKKLNESFNDLALIGQLSETAFNTKYFSGNEVISADISK